MPAQSARRWMVDHWAVLIALAGLAWGAIAWGFSKNETDKLQEQRLGYVEGRQTQFEQSVDKRLERIENKLDEALQKP